MPNINQIEIKRGTANGTVETSLYNIGSAAGVSAYGQIEEDFVAGLAKVRLSTEFDNFTFEEDAVICVRIEDTVDTGGAGDFAIELYKSDGTTQIESQHDVARQFGGSQISSLPVNSLAENTALLLLCRINNGVRWYYLIADNFKPVLGTNGVLTIG